MASVSSSPIEMIAFIFLAAVITVLLIYSSTSWFRICSQWNRAVILKWGKFSRVAGPGIFLLVPIRDKVAQWVNIAVRVTEITADKSLTKDTVPVTVAALLHWRVLDAGKAAIEVQDFAAAIVRTAQASLREAVGASTFAEILSDRIKVDEIIKESIARKIAGWGIEVSGIEIRDVIIPDSLQNAMSQEAQAEREKHARVILGESEKAIADNFLAAAQIYETSPTALQLRAMNIVYESMKNGGGTTILMPTSILDAFAAIARK